MEPCDIAYAKNFFEKGTLWMAVLGAAGGSLSGSLPLSSLQNEMFQNGMARIEMKGSARRLSAGRSVAPAAFSEDWRGLIKRPSARKGVLADLLHKVPDKEKSKNRSALYTLNEKVA